VGNYESSGYEGRRGEPAPTGRGGRYRRDACTTSLAGAAIRIRGDQVFTTVVGWVGGDLCLVSVNTIPSLGTPFPLHIGA
jgi:hypothetical protein